MLTAINFDDINLADVLEENTERLAEREAENNKWMNEDGTPKKNYVWKYASKTPQGDAGESVVATTIMLILSKVYGDDVQSRVINKGKGEYDILASIPDGREYKIEVKTATEDVNGCHQFNGLRKDVDYDFAFLFAVAPDKFFFEIASHEYLCETMTTNMSKEVVGSYKYTVAQNKLTEFDANAIAQALTTVGVM
jgi:hypothetical protein